jgi:RNA polymerase I-specific transcription initiation factor RRN7
MAQTPNPPGHPIALDEPSHSRVDGTEVPEEEKHDDDKGESSSDSEEGDQTEKEEGVDPDLLAELSDLSDDSEMNEVDTRETGSGPKWKRRRRLRVSDTLVTLILGLWTLRVPIMGVVIES